MIELKGQKAIRETKKGLSATKFAHTERNRIYAAALEFAQEQFQSDLGAIEAELKKAMKDRGHTYSRDTTNGEYYMSITTINQLLSAIHSAIKPKGEKDAT